MARLTGVNVTKFFNRELFMYALGDIRFKKPISLKKMAFTMLYLIIWTAPIIWIMGFQFNPVFLTFALVPPIAAGHYSTKPIFEGKNLVEFIRTMSKFVQEPKGWADLRNHNMETPTLFTQSEIWVGRRRELNMLAELKQEQKASKKPVRKTRGA